MAIVLAVLLPLLVLSGFAVRQMVQTYSHALEAGLQDAAHTLALAVDGIFAGHTAALAALAATAEFGAELDGADRLDVLRAHAAAEEVAAILGTEIALFDRDYDQVVNTRVPPGAALPQQTGRATVARTFQSGQPQVGNLLTGEVSGRPLVTASVPIRNAAGDVVLVASAAVEPERLDRLVRDQELQPSAFAAIVDGNGRLVARSQDAERFRGEPVPRWWPMATAGQDQGVAVGPNMEGVETIFAHATPSGMPTWTVVVALPAAAYAQAWRAPALALIGGGAAVLLLSLPLVWWLTARVVRPLAALAEHSRAAARAVHDGARPPAAPPDLPNSRVAEVQDMLQALTVFEGELAARDAQQTLMMGELDHRVRNVLATIQAMIRLTVDEKADKQAFAETLEGRIDAMGRAHSQLTETRWTGASLARLVREELSPYAGERVELSGFEAQGPDVMAPREALSLALVLHELTTNAAKYGALSGGGGRLRLRKRQVELQGERTIRLEWREEGGPPVATPKRPGFGSRLVAQSLPGGRHGRADLRFEPGGVACDIDLPARLFEAA
jgi:two-component sensor histidine kinase